MAWKKCQNKSDIDIRTGNPKKDISLSVTYLAKRSSQLPRWLLAWKSLQDRQFSEWILSRWLHSCNNSFPHAYALGNKSQAEDAKTTQKDKKNANRTFSTNSKRHFVAFCRHQLPGLQGGGRIILSLRIWPFSTLYRHTLVSCAPFCKCRNALLD